MKPMQQCLALRRRILGAALGLAVLAGTGSVAVPAWAEDTPATPPAAAATPATPAPEAPANTPEQAAKEAAPQAPPAKWIRGSFDADVDAAWSKHDSDIDLSQTLTLKADPPRYPRLHLRGSLWMNEDVDSDGDADSGLRDINNAYDSDVRARLLYLYADIDDLWGDSVLRLGRQRIEDGAAFNRIDGISFRQRVCDKWEWYLFGGGRASIYIDSHEDLTLGGGVTYRPNPSTRFSLDAYYGEENRSENDKVKRWFWLNWFDEPYPRKVKEDLNDTLVSLSAWHQVTPNLNVSGRFNWHDGEGDQLQLSATGYIPCADLTYDLAYRGQLNDVGDRVLDVDSFYRIVGELAEYNDFTVALHRPLTKKLALSVEAELHDSDGMRHWNTPNRSFRRYAAILDAQSFGPGLSASLGLEYYDTDGDRGTFAITGQLTKQWERLRVTVGADFNRYEDRVIAYSSVPDFLDKVGRSAMGLYAGYSPWVWFFDDFAVETHENVYSFYAKAKWSVRKNQDVTFGVTYEDDDEPDSPYWRIKAGYSIAF